MKENTRVNWTMNKPLLPKRGESTALTVPALALLALAEPTMCAMRIPPRCGGWSFFIGGRRTARRELESLSQNIRRLIPPRMVLIFIHRVIFDIIFPIASYSDDWVQSPVDSIELRSRHSAANPKGILKSG